MAELSAERRPLPVGSVGYHAFGFWGVLCLILTEGALFAYLLFSYYYSVVVKPEPWPPDGLPKFDKSLPDTIILIVSSFFVAWAEIGARRGKRKTLVAGLGIGLVLGIIFVVIQGLEWAVKPFTFTSGPYGALFYTVTGFHMAHVVAGNIILALLLFWSVRGYFSPGRNAPVTIGSLYWHFVDVVWLAVFFTFYITPYLGLR